MDAFLRPHMPGATAKEAIRPLVIVSILYIILNTIFVTLRFLSRTLIKRTRFGWDDWLIIPAYVFNIVGCAMGLVIAHHISKGNGPAELAILAPEQIKSMLEPTLRSAYIFVFFLILGLTFPKLSILALYLRLFAGMKTRFATWVLIALTMAMGIGFAFGGLFLCKPAAFFWDKMIPGGQCNDQNFYFRSFGLPNVLIDIGLIVVPIPAIWKLQMPTGKKLGLTVIFLTMVFTIVVSCIRWAIFEKYDVTEISPSTTTPLLFINIIECSTYLIVACLPASYPVVSRLAPAALRTRLDRLFSPKQTRPTKLLSSDSWSRSPSSAAHRRQMSGGNDMPLAHTYMRPDTPHGQGKASRVLGGDVEHGNLDRIARQMGLQDGRELRKGMGIAVTTEIEVTQEERIDQVLGL